MKKTMIGTKDMPFSEKESMMNGEIHAEKLSEPPGSESRTFRIPR